MNAALLQHQAAWIALPLWVICTSLFAGVLILLVGERRRRARVFINLAAASIKVLLVGLMLWGVARGHVFDVRIPLLPGVDFHLHADALTMLLATLSAVLWLLTTIYAIGYLEDSPNRARFFGFFSLCIAATMGVATAGNLLTFFLFYELLTISTWPLVVHRGTPEAIRAGNIYLLYTLSGGALLLIGIIALFAVTGDQSFIPGGFVDADENPLLLVGIFVLLLAGLGVKAAMVPLHGWLPHAMVAPAPVSALLHAVAVVKSGAFGIVRLINDVFGLELTAALGMNHLVVVAAAVTIIWGSLRALKSTELKQLLAFSTVSQISYIALGVGLGGPLALVGGLVHLVHQGLMKITLFFCAGNLAETHGVKRIEQMDGMGRRMPWTMTAFTLAALGMIGVPPMAGFITKWYLGLGALQAGQGWVLGVLVASTLLNAAYFLPILRRAWFAAPDRSTPIAEAPASLLVPALVTAALALAAGVLAGLSYSPLQWADFITEQFYRTGI